MIARTGKKSVGSISRLASVLSLAVSSTEEECYVSAILVPQAIFALPRVTPSAFSNCLLFGSIQASHSYWSGADRTPIRHLPTFPSRWNSAPKPRRVRAQDAETQGLYLDPGTPQFAAPHQSGCNSEVPVSVLVPSSNGLSTMSFCTPAFSDRTCPNIPKCSRTAVGSHTGSPSISISFRRLACNTTLAECDRP